ncbi:MAG: 30S ribosomal protein S6 [Chloroflexaceae bacterium]|nr:30S ribosomal protein S6 [Chloroflexaceae bacterium]
MNDTYEMMYILRPDLVEEQVSQTVSQFKQRLSDLGGHRIEVRNWGKRRLAYEINKHLDGVYVQMNYIGDGSQVAPLERDMRFSEEVIRYLTLKLEEDAAASAPSEFEDVTLSAPTEAVSPGEANGQTPGVTPPTPPSAPQTAGFSQRKSH